MCPLAWWKSVVITHPYPLSKEQYHESKPPASRRLYRYGITLRSGTVPGYCPREIQLCMLFVFVLQQRLLLLSGFYVLCQWNRLL